jgi:hypothetical protein
MYVLYQNLSVLSTLIVVYLQHTHKIFICRVNTKIWCPQRESNSRPRITKPMFYHLTTGANLERVARIELANKPWQGFRLPLHHTRNLFIIYALQSLVKHS